MNYAAGAEGGGEKEEGYRLRARIRKVSLSLYCSTVYHRVLGDRFDQGGDFFFFFSLSFFLQFFNPVLNVVIPIVFRGILLDF